MGSFLTSSPHFLCLVFFSPLVFTCCSGTLLCLHHEASALIHFKSSFSIQNFYPDSCTDSYPKTKSWKEDTDCCSWDGVTCDSVKGHVIALDLSCSWLHGTFPSNSSLLHLPHLQKLNLAFNHFNYSKMSSSEFGPFPSLVRLNLSHTYSAGKFPSQISHLSNLVILDLSQNLYEEPPVLDIYSLEGLVHNLTKVRHLFLDGIDMSSINLNVFINLSSSLWTLNLYGCDLQGSLPKNIFDSWNHIEFLNLGSNLIHGNLPIPGEATSIFVIADNRLSGEISSLICNASSLQSIELSHNNLSGTIPPCFGNLSKSLLTLNLKKNKLNGMIPPTFAKGCRLSYLNLNGNKFEGPLTTSILNCEALEVLDIGNNNINDTFPHWLGTLPQLKVLVLKSNQMHGSLQHSRPRSNHFFSKIQIFDLSCNYFSGPLPVTSFKAIINPEKNVSAMSYPYMGMLVHSKYSGVFYRYSIGIVVKGEDMVFTKIFVMWTIIDLSNNEFDGEIPEVIGKLSSLKGLNLSHNNLGGSIPSSIGNLTNLEWLDLSSNQLSGVIPQKLADLTFLSIFNVSGNQLHGLIPQSKQFSTFGNDSYEGNKGLCGFPVSKNCSINKPPPPEEDGSKSDFSLEWKAVLLGYGCGVVLGLSMGYVVFETGKPKWIVNLVQDYLDKRRSREPKIAYRNINGRRRRV